MERKQIEEGKEGDKERNSKSQTTRRCGREEMLRNLHNEDRDEMIL